LVILHTWRFRPELKRGAPLGHGLDQRPDLAAAAQDAPSVVGVERIAGAYDEVVLATNDKDLFQLVNEHVRVYSTNKADLASPKDAFALLGAESVMKKCAESSTPVWKLFETAGLWEVYTIQFP